MSLTQCLVPAALFIILCSTDFERGFISAEIMKYQDLKELGTENAVKAAGKFLQKGKDYVMEDGDIAHFKVIMAFIREKYKLLIIGFFDSLMVISEM